MFRKLSEAVWVSPQITTEDVAAAAAQGIGLIINNRPEGESDDQTPGDAIADSAAALGLAYVAIPVTHAGFSEGQVQQMAQALAEAKGGILAYCRSGTRSTLLWALAQAATGTHPDDIARAAALAGYDIGPVRALVDMLAAGQN
ncbi:MAG TPA: TIGR01244 family sulfur transferase [Novosphingobium sp.]|nr:TIGR01244 family sulfur transferase [Novosphingobium sp.]HZV10886.1 TIGR01244 family sulfur transferase [Novosphingobium sp.]